MVDPERFAILIDRLREETDQLRDLAEGGEEALREDRHLLAAVKYRFIVAIEVCADIARHVIAADRLRLPATYAEAFEVLCEAGYLPERFRAIMKEMVRFRNRLVHVYDEVEDSRVIEILHEGPADLDGFRESLARAVREGQPEDG